MSKRSVQFARALIVASGIVGLGAGCGRGGVVEPGSDGGGVAVVDAGAPIDGGLACIQCDCLSADAGKPSCFDVGRSECCFAVGPLPPPDLPLA
ncbi:MAG: hypothetical protein MUC96_20095 [Myxococcaceae bacterium]|jgi:hypothetical protein|nr:hypothetical protein [Myxococcaceae bacterium]